jgi:hypothetical protein
MSCAASVLATPSTAKIWLEWKEEPETSWLTDVPPQALQQSLKDLENAWEQHFDRSRS